MTIGVMSKMVVTLSRKADTTAVIRQRMVRSGQTRPFDTLKATKPSQLKTPVSDRIETMIIMLNSRVLKLPHNEPWCRVVLEVGPLTCYKLIGQPDPLTFELS